MIPLEAYKKARESGYTRELEEIACKEPAYAYWFARDVPEADIKYCQEHACKKPGYAFLFARHVPEANIEYCQEWACKDPKYAYWFTCGVPEADLNYCLEACKGTEYYAKIQALIMEEAIG